MRFSKSVLLHSWFSSVTRKISRSVCSVIFLAKADRYVSLYPMWQSCDVIYVASVGPTTKDSKASTQRLTEAKNTP